MTAETTTDGHRAVWLARAVVLVVAVVPMVLSSPGRVSADSRQYLYLDPGGFLARAVSLWDPSVAAGTVPHQHLGFLWPMGPWFWLVDAVGLPIWVGQRLWLAGLSALAGFGVMRLARSLGAGPLVALVAALAYQLTPYQLAFTARFSVLLLPWVALPWLVHLARRSVLEPDWRAPLTFGLVAGTAGAVNASSLLLVLVAPAAVLAAAAAGAGLRSAGAAAARIAACTLLASAWWLAGIIVQGRYGLPVLQFTENVDTVAAASRADDVVRGLGNWIFTSTDGADTAIEQAGAYQDAWAVRLATIALPAAALALAVLVPIRHRIAIVATMTVATVVGTGHAPLGDSSAYGRLWRRFAEDSSVGLALRNTPRIVPVIVLGTAVLLALGLHHLHGARRIVGATVALATVAVAISPVLRHGFLADDFDRAEHLPDRWVQVAADLDAIGVGPTDPGARVLEIPGSNFAAHTWGNTVEPVLPGLVERPTIAREVLPAGGYGTIDLLAALDRRLLNGTFDDRALAPVARLLGVGDIVVRGDLDTARFGLPPIGPLIASLDARPPPGFRVNGRYGTDAQGRPLLLRLTLLEPTGLLRTDASAPILLAGDGDGIVDAAVAGIVDGTRTVLPEVTTGPVALDDALARGAQVVVTDTNRKAATTFFYTIADDVGATEAADATEPDPTGYDVRLGPYAQAPIEAKTVAVQLGGAVSTTLGGGPERPEDRAVHAFDGTAATVWRPRGPAVGQQVTVRFDEPVPADDVEVLSTVATPVTRVRITTDSGASTVADLGEAARTDAGQSIPLGVDRVQRLTVEILAVAPGGDGAPAPGLRDVRVGAARVDEVLRMPTSLVDRAGERLAGRPVQFVLTRRLGDRFDPIRQPVEHDIDRFLSTPIGADYVLSGRAAGGGDGRCRDDLVVVDGVPVAVAIDADGLVLGCSTVRLEPGEHRVTSAPVTPDLAIDQLVLSAGPDPRPPALLTPTEMSLATRSGQTTVDARGRFWFTLAQSRNDGWELDVDGGRVLATSMTDGYANGWLVEPSGDGPVQLSLQWTPQRIVWAGFLITGLLIPMAIVVFGTRRRRPHRPDTAWEATTFRDLPSSRRATAAGLGVLAWTAAWWFVAGTAPAVVATSALVLRATVPQARVALAVGAPAALLAAEFTDRPSLVFVGLALALAEALVADRGLDQLPIRIWRSTPASSPRGYQ